MYPSLQQQNYLTSMKSSIHSIALRPYPYSARISTSLRSPLSQRSVESDRGILAQPILNLFISHLTYVDNNEKGASQGPLEVVVQVLRITQCRVRPATNP